ncbi:SDR family oxidoreductase [Salicibibacter cibi]|uniref:SDR family oxidoreductase n=1 Tax=Salicibibacter cibi TaxID=2743001 RepID=A0A7T6Z961_9BACI|nr:SDR family oxidoreductase [Salicibibacter cibi]QQK79002.1 SDR family oxidoreductase [Salicibibacter cibi]
MKRVLVAGATGYLGRYVVKDLKRQGFYTKVLVRNPEKLNQEGDFFAPSIREDADEVAIGDVTKPDTLKHVCDNIDYVFSSIGITGKNNGLTFQDVDYQGNVNLLKEAERSHIAKFMYIHVCSNDEWKKSGPLIEAKERFVNVLKTSNVDHIIICPTGYFSDLTNFLTMAKKGRAFLIGDGKTRMNPIHGEDLAQFCVQSFLETNQTLDIGGPEILTYEQIAQLAFEVLGQKERITNIPVSLLNPVSLGLKLCSNHHYGVYRFFINVMTHHLIAPMYGKHKLKDFMNQRT